MKSTLIHANCLDILDKMRSNIVDFTLFSPPYDKVREYTGDSVVNLPRMGRELYRVTKDGGICAVIINDGTKDFAKSLTTYRLILDWCDNSHWRLFENCIYSRPGRPGAWWNQRFRVDHEYILLFLKGAKPKTFHKQHMYIPTVYPGVKFHGTDRLSNGTLRQASDNVAKETKCPGTIWKYNASTTERKTAKALHPAPFPDKLAEDLILCFTDEGDTVLDPMCGSGTTLRMAKKHKRIYGGIDISAEYVEIAQYLLNNNI